ncbi:hypothetical protein FRC05_000745 [Tulasnella sp. 425]|nr:hypothetical protein FRC05_000745 [Tulasnella sp. 425]
MADLHIDSQLMSHFQPLPSIIRNISLPSTTKSISPLSSFCSAIGNDGHLYAIKANGSGSSDTINVSSAVGARGTVDAFIVKQANDADYGIFLAFSSTVNDSPASELHVLSPFKPEVLDTPDQLTSHVILGEAQNAKVKINALYMGKATKTSRSDWPLLIASYNYVSEHNKDANISRILVTLIKTIVQGLMKIGQIVLTGTKDLLNSSIFNFGIFGGLLKKLFGLPDFSILDVPPKKIQNFDFAMMVEKCLPDDQALLVYNELGSYIAITKALVHAIMNVSKMATVEALVETPPFSAARLTVDLIGLLLISPGTEKHPAGNIASIVIWRVRITNTIVISVCTHATSPYILKIMTASDILVGLFAFSLAQVVHREQLTGNWKGRYDEKTALDISGSVFDLVEKLSTAVSILTPEPLTKLTAGAVMGTSAACKAVVKTGIAVKKAHEQTLVTINTVSPEAIVDGIIDQGGEHSSPCSVAGKYVRSIRTST